MRGARTDSPAGSGDLLEPCLRYRPKGNGRGLSLPFPRGAGKRRFRGFLPGLRVRRGLRATSLPSRKARRTPPRALRVPAARPSSSFRARPAPHPLRARVGIGRPLPVPSHARRTRARGEGRCRRPASACRQCRACPSGFFVAARCAGATSACGARSPLASPCSRCGPDRRPAATWPGFETAASFPLSVAAFVPLPSAMSLVQGGLDARTHAGAACRGACLAWATYARSRAGPVRWRRFEGSLVRPQTKMPHPGPGVGRSLRRRRRGRTPAIRALGRCGGRDGIRTFE